MKKWWKILREDGILFHLVTTGLSHLDQNLLEIIVKDEDDVERNLKNSI